MSRITKDSWWGDILLNDPAVQSVLDRRALEEAPTQKIQPIPRDPRKELAGELRQAAIPYLGQWATERANNVASWALDTEEDKQSRSPVALRQSLRDAIQVCNRVDYQLDGCPRMDLPEVFRLSEIWEGIILRYRTP